MTNLPASAAQGVFGPSKKPRTADTFRLQVLMEEAKRLEMAQRITELRERSPFTQPQIADKLGLGLRAYQKLEARGTTKFERCEELAAIHQTWTHRSSEWAHVDADWIWDGRRESDTPDVLGELSSDAGGLAAAGVQKAIEDLQAELRATRTQLLAEIAKVRTAQEAQRPSTGRRGRTKGASGS